MIPWKKFLSDEPTYSDHVYHPTPWILANRVPYLAHQDILMNAPPLENAEDRRFVIAQLSPELRDHHFSAFHAEHPRRIQRAIDTLMQYYEQHKLKPLSAYDRDGWPGRYNESGEHEDLQRSSFVRMRKRDDREEALVHSSSHPDSALDIQHGEHSLTDHGISDDPSESEFDYDSFYDFPTSLAGLSLDSVDGLFGSEGFFEPARAFAPELSLSPTSTRPPSPSQKLLLDGLIRGSSTSPSSSPTLQQRTSTPSPLTISVAATIQFSLLPPLTFATRTVTHPTLSIANLIHHDTSPHTISRTANTVADHSDPEIGKLFSISEADLLSTTLSSIGLRPASNERPQSNTPTALPPDNSQSSRDHLNAFRSGILPIPRIANRTYKSQRMRRNSRPRPTGEKVVSGSRRGSGAEIDKAKAKVQSEATGDQQRQSRCDQDEHGQDSKGQFQPYSYEYGGIDWNQPIDRESTASSPSDAADPMPREEELDRDTAHQLPTNAIKYEPLNDTNPVPKYQQQLRQGKRAVSLKRKDRGDDDTHAGPSSKPRLQSDSWTISGAPYWPAVPSYAPMDSADSSNKEERSGVPRSNYHGRCAKADHSPTQPPAPCFRKTRILAHTRLRRHDTFRTACPF